MATIAEMQRRFARLNVRRELPVIIEDREQEITNAVKEQLRQGTDGTGNKIQPEYASLNYALEKHQSNSAPGYGVPDLNLSGSHYAGIRLESVTPTMFSIGSSDSKSAALQLKYGPIYALAPTSWEKLIRNYIGPDIRGYVTNVTKLAFT